MKNKIILAALLATTLAVLAGTPAYSTKTAGGNNTTGASVIFPADPALQIRIVGVNWQSDTNNAVLQCSSGVGAYVLLATNTTTGVTQTVNTVTGMAANDILVLEHAGVGYAATLSSTNGGTNAVLASGAWGVTPAIGDSVYKMSDIASLPIGNTTNWQAGEAIYVGNRGRPVRLLLTPAAVTNRINSATAFYE